MYFDNEIINSIKKPTSEQERHDLSHSVNEDDSADDSDESSMGPTRDSHPDNPIVDTAPDVPLEELLAYYRYIQTSVAESLRHANEANRYQESNEQQGVNSTAITTSTSRASTVEDSHSPIIRESHNDEVENSQSETNDDDKQGTVHRGSKEKIRVNVVLELINSERDFVKHLKDVIEGYLYPARRHPEMFTPEQIANIFSNIEALYAFQCEFLENLESCINWSNLAASEVGQCFLDYERCFDVYHEYCNNHPNAIGELQDLFVKQRYARFFEACRLLRSMIDISLDGFLLTPIQKICKYPLQLSELLKHTPEDHTDYVPVLNALETMRRCASLANERKRRIEALADLIAFQNKIDIWYGPKLWETSSILIHSGEVTKMTSHTWSQSVHLYLFDHMLLYFKRDLLKRNSLMLRGRICMDTVTEISDVGEYKVRKSFKLYCNEQQKWFTFTTRNQREKEKWLKAFSRERELVLNDEKQGFKVTDRELAIARRALQSKNRTRSARYRSVRREKPDTTIVDHLDLDTSLTMNRTLSLPSCIHPSHVMNFVEDSKLSSANSKSRKSQTYVNGGPGWFKKMGSKKMSKQSAALMRAELTENFDLKRHGPGSPTLQINFHPSTMEETQGLKSLTESLSTDFLNSYSDSSHGAFNVKEDTV